MDKSQLQFGDSSIEVHHQGAHLSSWLYQGKEQLFLSRKSLIQPAQAIRGGVPICFPQFGAFGPGQKHGFARNVLWQKCDSKQPNVLRFELCHDKHSLACWPHEFKVLLDIKLEDNTLSMSLVVKNVGRDVMEFTVALHSYFRVDAISSVIVEGLKSCEFWDNGDALTKRKHQQKNELRIDKMIDRVYFNSLKPVSLRHAESTSVIENDGFADTVIWNPWSEGASALVDMADDEYQQMLCIESANVQTATRLASGQTWQGIQKITIVKT